MKQYKEENPGCLKLALIILLFVAISILLFSSCSSQKEMPQYKVVSVEKIKGNAYRIKTDSFEVIRIVRGAGGYKPKTINKQGYKF